MTVSAERLAVEVIYARPEVQFSELVELPAGATVRDAIAVSGVLTAFPEIDLDRNRVGVYGRIVALDAPVRDRDRVEIYRPLKVDPKEQRRRRAAER